jgi:hypothetical protein
MGRTPIISAVVGFDAAAIFTLVIAADGEAAITKTSRAERIGDGAGRRHRRPKYQ